MKLHSLIAPLFALAALAPPANADDPVGKPLNLSFGVYQTDKATEMYRQFTPLLEALREEVSESLARPVDIELEIFRTYEDGQKALASGKVDFVHFGPASYIKTKEQNPKIQLLAMEHENGEKRFKGVIIVPKNSPLKSIEDLKGKRFAFGDRNSTVGRYLVQAELAANGVFARDLASFKYLERHDQVAAAVANGDFDAGSVKNTTFKKANEKDTLRALATFENVGKPVVAREGLPADVFGALQQGLYAIKDPAALKPLKISGFMVTDDDEYAFVRIGMKKSEEFEGTTSQRHQAR